VAQEQPPKAPYSSVVALVMARAQKQLAEQYQDSDLQKHAAVLEQRALQAIKDGKSELPPLQ
jgi:hypothetical protein